MSDAIPFPIVLFEAVPKKGYRPIDVRSPASQRFAAAMNACFDHESAAFKAEEIFNGVTDENGQTLKSKIFEARNLFPEKFEDHTMYPCATEATARAKAIAGSFAGRTVIMANRVAETFRAAFGRPYEDLPFCKLSSADWIAKGCRAGWIYHSWEAMEPLFNADMQTIGRFLYVDVVVAWRKERRAAGATIGIGRY